MSTQTATTPPAGTDALVLDKGALTPAAEPLKLFALDGEDLTVVSALMQDAVTRTDEMQWLKDKSSFVLVANRLAREERPERSGPFGWRKSWQRRRSMLDIRRVTAVKRRGFTQLGDVPLVLLAIRHERTGGEQDPAGTIWLDFAGGASVRLDVEVLEARLTDLGPAWKSAGTPRHAA